MSDNQQPYVKVVVEGEIACYISDAAFASFFKAYISMPRQRTMIQFSDIVVDLQSDEFIKFRYSKEQFMDAGFPRPVLTMVFKGVV